MKAKAKKATKVIKFRKGKTYRSVSLLDGRLTRFKFKVERRVEGYYSHDFAVGCGNRLPRVTLVLGKTTFYSLPVRTKFGIEYVDLRDIDTRVVAKTV